MPDGSSSAAPVINPGPKIANDLFRSLESFAPFDLPGGLMFSRRHMRRSEALHQGCLSEFVRQRR